MKLLSLIAENVDYYLGEDPKELTALTKYLEKRYVDGIDYIAHVGYGEDMRNLLTILNKRLLKDRKLAKLIKNAEENMEEMYGLEEDNIPDTILLDIPLFIRLLEYAKEDAKSDMDLHSVAERAINLSVKKKRALTMGDYEDLMLATKF